MNSYLKGGVIGTGLHLLPVVWDNMKNGSEGKFQGDVLQLALTGFGGGVMGAYLGSVHLDMNNSVYLFFSSLLGVYLYDYFLLYY